MAVFPLASWASGICVRVNEATVKKFERLPAGKKRKPQTINKKTKPITLVKYTPLFWTGEKEKGWLKVEDMRGNPLLIRKKDISFNMKCVAVHVGKSRLRKGPGSQYEQAPVAKRGDGFLDLGSEDGWIQVMNNKGEKAWINIDHTWRPTSRMRMKFEPESMNIEP